MALNNKNFSARLEQADPNLVSNSTKRYQLVSTTNLVNIEELISFINF